MAISKYTHFCVIMGTIIISIMQLEFPSMYLYQCLWMRYHLNEHPVILLLREEYLPIEEFCSLANLLGYTAHQAMEETNYD